MYGFRVRIQPDKGANTFACPSIVQLWTSLMQRSHTLGLVGQPVCHSPVSPSTLTWAALRLCSHDHQWRRARGDPSRLWCEVAEVIRRRPFPCASLTVLQSRLRPRRLPPARSSRHDHWAARSANLSSVEQAGCDSSITTVSSRHARLQVNVVPTHPWRQGMDLPV